MRFFFYRQEQATRSAAPREAWIEIFIDRNRQHEAEDRYPAPRSAERIEAAEMPHTGFYLSARDLPLKRRESGEKRPIMPHKGREQK